MPGKQPAYIGRTANDEQPADLCLKRLLPLPGQGLINDVTKQCCVNQAPDGKGVACGCEVGGQVIR